MNTARWKQRPPGSNWGDFGADDQLGRLNLITRDKLRQGLVGGRSLGLLNAARNKLLFRLV
jgi:hypothetical protein